MLSRFERLKGSFECCNMNFTLVEAIGTKSSGAHALKVNSILFKWFNYALDIRVEWN